MTAIIARPAVGATKAETRPAKGAQNPKSQPPLRCATSTAESASPSLIVLTLRPDGQKFNGNRIERAQEAGFAWLNKIHLIGLSSEDTDEEIARHVVNHGDEAMGNLNEIQVHIDPQLCAFRWYAGDYLIECLKKYAILIGGHICDGMGQPLADEAIGTIAKYINDVMERRRDADRLARTITLPSGETRELTELSFAYDVVREAGRKRRGFRAVRFDVPALHYYEGRALGMQMAGEIVQFYSRHKEKKLDLRGILSEAMRSYGDSYGSLDKATIANVASGFFDVMNTLIEVGARHLNPKWLEGKIAQSKRHHEDWLREREEAKAEFVARMKSAREAKQKGGRA